MLTLATDVLDERLKDILDGAGARPSPMGPRAKEMAIGTKVDNLIRDLLETREDLDALPLSAVVMPDPTELTISAGGSVTITQSRHTIDTAADGATDDLDTIAGGEAEGFLLISPASDARDVVIRNIGGGTGNIVTPGAVSITLAEDDDMAMLFYTGTVWSVVAYKTAANGGGGLAIDLASVANGKGASLVGIQDAAATITAVNVETALAELSARARGIICTFTASASAEALNVVTLTLNLVDLAGTPVSRVQRFRIELFAADMVRLATADFTMAVTTGTITSTTAKGDIIANTDASGDAVVTITDVGGGYNATIFVLITPIQPTGTYQPATPVMTTAAFDVV